MRNRTPLVFAICATAFIALIWIHANANEDNTAVLMLNPAAKQRLREAVDKAGRGPSPAERAQLRHLMMPIANHLATRFDRLLSQPKAKAFLGLLLVSSF
jgi:hypothetical protein